MSLVILHAPNHGPTVTQRNLAFALSKGVGAHSVGFSEAYNHTAYLTSRTGWRTVVDVGSDTRRGGKDNPILTRKSLTNLGSFSVQASAASTPLKIAPQRWLHVSMFQASTLGRVAHLNIHPNAAVQGESRNVDRVEKYIDAMDTLDQMLTFLSGTGFRIVGTGDLNFGLEKNPTGWEATWAPQVVLKRHHLEWWREGIDWIFHGPSLKIAEQKKYTPAQTGSDHPWMRATFTL